MRPEQRYSGGDGMALTAAAESQSKRGTILIVVIAVHAIGLWVVESGLSRSIIEMVAPPVETKIIEEEKPPEEPPPPPPGAAAGEAAASALCRG